VPLVGTGPDCWLVDEQGPRFDWPAGGLLVAPVRQGPPAELTPELSPTMSGLVTDAPVNPSLKICVPVAGAASVALSAPGATSVALPSSTSSATTKTTRTW